MNFSIIQKSQLEAANRLDSDYYQPEYLKIGKLLETSKRISDVADTYDLQSNGAFKQIFNILNDSNDKTVPYIRSENAGDFFINTTDLVFISQEAHTKLLKTQTKLEDVVMARKGKIGGATLITQDVVNFNSNDNIVNIKIRNKKLLDPYYFVTFFNSGIGLREIERLATGNVQPWLSMFQLRSLKVFIPTLSEQLKIRRVVEEAFRYINNSKLYYFEAENLLLEELELTDFKPREDSSFVVNLLETQEANRIDPDFFQPKYKEILQRLIKHQAEPLEKHFRILRSKNFPYYEEGEIGVIKTKQLGKQFINFEVEDKTKKEILEKEELPTIQNLDIVFASMGVGSLGKTNIFYDFKNDSKFTVDSTLRIFRQIKNGKILPEVLTVYLSSSIGQQLIYKYVVGSSGIISIYEEYLKNFSVPVLSIPTQEKIADLVRKSHETRKKSKELLEEAKRKVEEMIEKGGES